MTDGIRKEHDPTAIDGDEQLSHPPEDCVGRRTTIVSGRGIDIRISTIVSAVDGDS